MPRTPVCDVFRIDHPIVGASLGPWSSAELTAAVSNAGGLGSLGTALKRVDALTAEIERVRDLTDRPFAVNHTARPLDEEAFRATLAARPPVISYALGDPGDLVERGHEVGSLFVQQVHSVRQAEVAAERGADAIIAQGWEAGGFGGTVAALALVPQVVDAVAPVPVLAAGGIANGRGFAAALMLGAQGINVGTIFLAAREAGIAEAWQRRLLDAESEDAVRVEFAEAVFPPAGEGGFETRPRVLRTAFVDTWNARVDGAFAERDRLGAELAEAVRGRRAHELVPFTGQTAGMVREVRPAAEIVAQLVREAEEALARAVELVPPRV